MASRITNILRMASNSMSQAKGRMADYVRGFKGRLGKVEGHVVGAHRLARIVWAMIVYRQPYAEAKALQGQRRQRRERENKVRTAGETWQPFVLPTNASKARGS